MTIPSSQQKLIRECFRRGPVVCLTGAGLSVESGIPAFRGAGGLWERYDPEVYAYPQGLGRLMKEDPEKLAQFLIELYTLLLSAKPNLGHYFLTVLEREGLLQPVITQNVDNLHSLAGSREVVELHGNAFKMRCTSCPASRELERDRAREMAESLKASLGSRSAVRKVLGRYFPKCPCGGRFRTDVVLFQEALPEAALARAYQMLDTCTALLLVGTSLEVYPAAGMPIYAKDKGAVLIEVNKDSTQMTGLCDIHIPGPAHVTLPEIARLVTNA